MTKLNYKMKNAISILSGVLLFLIIISIVTDANAQKKISVTAIGSYEARDLTLEEVKNKAIEEAKHRAMVEAGISENVKVSDFLYTFEDDKKFQDIFQSFISTETGADIIVEEVREKKRDINEFGNILIEVEIDAIIIKHKEKKDPAFSFKVEGIRDVYYENDPLNFNITPTRDGYLKIFNIFDEDVSIILYPNIDPENAYLNDDPDRIFLKNVKANFPINNMMDGYYFEIANKDSEKEYNLLIFVYTKEDYPYFEELDVTNIMNWIFKIPLNQRSVQQFGIVIKR